MKNINSVYNDKKILQFADDIVLWQNEQFIDDIVEKLNKKIKSVSEWCRRRGLKMSPEKCVPVIFTRKRKIEQPKIIIDGKKLD